MRLNIGQIRFFLRKQDEQAALKKKSKELNDKLKAQEAARKKLDT
jgi:hypothetical protein